MSASDCLAATVQLGYWAALFTPMSPCRSGGKTTSEEHLSATLSEAGNPGLFLAGTLALGVAHRFGQTHVSVAAKQIEPTLLWRRPDHPNAARDLQTAEDLGDTCVKMYTQQATGVAAEYARFDRPPRCNSARLTLPE